MSEHRPENLPQQAKGADNIPQFGPDVRDEQVYDFICDRSGCDFRSLGWPSIQARDARASEHYEEHSEGTPMTELHKFGREHGVH